MKRLLCALLCGSLGVSVSVSLADEAELSRQEPVIVTGSYAGYTGLPGIGIELIERSDLLERGNPFLSDLVRGWGSSSGVDGQSNQYASGWLSGVSNINLRAIGPARTLILLNGRRLALSALGIDEQAQSFTDINQIPQQALSRIELLDSGASSLYGSDAIAGVVNFVTDSGEGKGVSANYRAFSGSGGDFSLSAHIGRTFFERTTVFLLFGGDFRSEMSTRNRDWAVRPYADNPQGAWSSIGNPGSFVARPNIEAGLRSASPAGSLSYAVSDPGCAELGGVDAGILCRFQFGQFSNLVEDSRHRRALAAISHEFSDNLRWHSELLLADTDLPFYDTSPSLPPQDFLGQIVPAHHPALIRYRADNPQWAEQVYRDHSDDNAAALDPDETDLIYFGRPFAIGGNPLTGGKGAAGSRYHRHWRLLSELSGQFGGQIDWQAALSWGGSDARRIAYDTYRHGVANALAGYGLCSDPVSGAIPEGARPGLGDCVYYNPFASAIEVSAANAVVNPGYREELANSLELANWLFGELQLEASTRLIELDFGLNGGTGLYLPGGEIRFAAGLDYRRDHYSQRPDNISNLALYPGQSGAGIYSFLSGAYAEGADRDVYALFGELFLRPLDALKVQLALRFEDHLHIGRSLDPKLALDWQLSSFLAVHAGVWTAFRAPEAKHRLDSVITSLQYIAPTGAFKPVDMQGDPRLRPEKALGMSTGLVFTHGGILAGLDYWRLELRDALMVESHADIIAAAGAALERGELAAPILQRISFVNSASPNMSEISRVTTRIINGSHIVTSGLGLVLESSFDGPWSGHSELGVRIDYVFDFRVGAYDVEGVEMAGGEYSGQFNRSNSFRSQPRWKGRLHASHMLGRHRLRAELGMVGAYADERVANRIIGAHIELDLHYLLDLSEQMQLSFSVRNILDTAPPFAAFEVNYDPYTHSPLGRVVKLGLVWKQ